MHRRFVLVRDADLTGVSGTGKVAEGVHYGDGSVSMRWCVPGKPSSTSTYAEIGDVELIHGHGGSTRVVWIDEQYAQRDEVRLLAQGRTTINDHRATVRARTPHAAYWAPAVGVLCYCSHGADHLAARTPAITDTAARTVSPDCKCDGVVHVCV